MFNTASLDNASRDCPEPCNDTVSDLAWNWPGPHAHACLGCSSWDGTVRLWEVQTQAPLNKQPTPGLSPATGTADPVPVIGNIVCKALFNNNSPTTSCKVLPDSSLISGTLDKRVILHNVTANTSQQIGAHDSSIRKVFFDGKRQAVCSISVDGGVRWWDSRSPSHVAALTVPAQIADADMNESVVAVLAENRTVYLYDLNNIGANPKTYPIESYTLPLERIALSPDSLSCVVAGLEGRAKVVNLMPQNSKDDFNFRAHRTNDSGEIIIGASGVPTTTKIYTVNAVDFNATYKTLITAGGDGRYTTWDKDNRQKLHHSNRYPQAITAMKYDPSGRMLAIGLGYDWSKGICGRNPNCQEQTNRIVVVCMKDSQIKNKKK